MTKREIAVAAVRFLRGKRIPDAEVEARLDTAISVSARGREIAETVIQHAFDAVWKAGYDKGRS